MVWFGWLVGLVPVLTLLVGTLLYTLTSCSALNGEIVAGLDMLTDDPNLWHCEEEVA